MKYTEMAVLLGNKCTAECEMCCFSSNMYCSEKLEINRIRSFVESAKDVDEIETIHFSGGEVFLYYDMLLELIQTCNNISKKSTIITNGFWANKKEDVYRRLGQLKEAGLWRIGVSYDEFHQKFIPIDNIRNIISVAKELRLSPSIQVAVIRGSNNGQWIDSLSADLANVIIDFITCDNVGRALENIKDSDYLRSVASKGCICRKGRTFSILYDGSVWPCCSPSVCDTMLCIGNIYDDITTVDDAMSRLQRHPILKILRNRGFDFFREIAIEENIIEVPEMVISSCELCKMFFEKNKIKKFYQGIYRKLESDKGCRKK